ncbi:serine/threonine-protein kinase [Actinomadura rudentiformis]|uniref:non-specific serine/threonine protein kinase n=1 Tax=Actinomadura rudentiformis TaxID=359158 RepID=A0A6H9Z5L5_9ACTN|nr:serine/threonine-protein kinase [Actinomadura rudentiformis]KAB2351409.1 protein kinase [Actinomadura rudentiformis]
MPNDTTGERLLAGRYRLGTQVGRGGMGTVWQAHDEVLGRDVAVKEVILPHGLTDEERSVQYKRTFREARTAARLGHPGVVTVYDVVEEDGRPWIIMELIHARSLDQVIKQEGPLEPRRAAEIGRQMLAALHAAHDAGVLHRDVKPSNVLITRGDRAVLTDFGIATASGDATLTQTGLVMGSPAYIAPERARGRIAGPASDLWSLGVTLYAMVEGKSPFERAEPMAALVAIISDDPTPPANAGPLTPVIEGLLTKNPDQRMDAIEAGALLDEIVRRETVDTQRTLAVEVSLEDLMAEGTAADPTYPEPRYAEPAYNESTYNESTYNEPAYSEPRYDEPSSPEPAYAEAPPEPKTVLTPQPEQPAITPETEPVSKPPASGNPALPLSRNVLIVIGVVVVVLVAIIGFALAQPDNEKQPPVTPTNSKGTASKSASKVSSPSSPPATPKATTGIPEGFQLHKDQSGFSIAIPDDWKGPNRRGSSPTSVFFDAPDGISSIQVDQTSDPNPSALEDWEKQEPKSRGNFDGYDKIKIAPVVEGKPVADRTGKKAADWEWTYNGKGRRMHALNRGFVMNGMGYAIVLYAPHKDWDKTLADLAPVYEHFTSRK